MYHCKLKDWSTQVLGDTSNNSLLIIALFSFIQIYRVTNYIIFLILAFHKVR